MDLQFKEPVPEIDGTYCRDVNGTGSSNYKKAPDILTKVDNFPATRYYGSKRRLLQWLYVCLSELDFSTTLDAFGGSASVSLLFKAMGKKVTFNDVLLSNCVSAEAVLADSNPIDNLSEGYRFIDSIEGTNGFISREFKKIFYLNAENAWLDGAIQKIRRVRTPLKRSIYTYCLMQACLMKRPFNLFHRANLYLRTNKVERSFGNLATWNKPFPVLMKRSLNEISKVVWPGIAAHTILPPGDAANLKVGYDLVYIDPPYIGQERSSVDYLRRYHFLEGLCEYDLWSSNIDSRNSAKAYHSRSCVSDWNRKTTAKKLLFDFIWRHRKSIVVLSYWANAWPDEKELLRHFRDIFSSVQIFKKPLSHALAREQKTELLIVGLP